MTKTGCKNAHTNILEKKMLKTAEIYFHTIDA